MSFLLKKRLSQKGSLFNFVNINNIMLVSFHIVLVCNDLYLVYLLYESKEEKI